MNRKKTERYPIEQSGFYRLGTQRALADLLGFKLARLKGAVTNRQLWYHFRDEEINGKSRSIQFPVGLMRAIHERLKLLFNRVDRPDYLHAPRCGSSYVTNAQAHAHADVITTLDIRKFYPSTTSEHVFQYFFHRLGMRKDVAGLLTKLCTIDDKVPFGSPVSPILCFHVHRHLFDEVVRLCASHGLVMTLYVDDIAISGTDVPNSVIYQVKKVIHNARLQYHKVHRRPRSKQPVITGVQITKNGTTPTNKSHRRMKQKLDELKSVNDKRDRLVVIKSLIGMNQHMIQTYSEDHPARVRFHRQKSWLHNQRRHLMRAIQRSELVSAGARLDTSANTSNVPF